MLFRIRYAVFALAILSGSVTAFAQNAPQNRPPKPVTATAVVDLDHVFDNHPTFNTQKEALKDEYKKTMEEFEGRRAKLAQDASTLEKKYNPDSPEFKAQQEKIVQDESKLRLEAMNKEKEFGERQAKLILDTYKSVTGAVESIAAYYQYDLVVRYSRKQMSSMDSKKPNSVMMGVAEREVIYFNPAQHDLTEATIGVLNQQAGKTAPATSPGAASTTNGGGNQGPRLGNGAGSGNIRK